MGANEAKLDRAVQAHPGAIEQAADTWQKAAAGLGKVKERLDDAKQSIAAAWTGDDADAATAAFTSLSGNVDTNKTRMESASTALNTAAQGIREAQTARASLPPAGVLPSQPAPGAGGEVTHEQKIAYSSGVDQATAADARREKAAARAYNDLQGALRDSQITMTAAAPPRYDTGGTTGGTGGGGGTTTGGGTGGGLPGAVGGGGPVGPYSTSTGGTHVHAQVVGSGGHIIGFDPLVHPIAGWHPGTTADGVVDGTVGGSLGGGTGGSALGLTGGATVAGGLGGSTPGSLAGGAVGGLSGVLGGAGALGSLRGGASSATNAGSAVAGRLGGAAGPLGGVPGSTTSAVGGATRGATLGSVGRSAVVGGTPGATGTSGSAGSTGRTGMMPGSGTAGGQSTGGAGRSASGRYASAAAEEEAAAGRGGRSSTGLRSGGRSAVTSEGAGGRGTGTAGGPGAGKDDKAAKRKGMVFEDDDAWLDEDESGPGVIR